MKICGHGFMNLKGWNVMRLIDADNLKRTLSASDNIPWLKGIPVTDVYINKQLGIDVGDISFDRLAEICEAEREGRLVVLPCGIGNVVYFIKANIIKECTIFSVTIERNGTTKFGASDNNVSGFCFDLYDYGLGEIWFFTRDEAEKALAEMEDDDEN